MDPTSEVGSWTIVHALTVTRLSTIGATQPRGANRAQPLARSSKCELARSNGLVKPEDGALQVQFGAGDGMAGRSTKPAGGVTHGPNRTAVEESLKHLATRPHHAALVAAVRSLADVVDAEYDDKAWREYRFALRSLMEAAGGGSDELEDELNELRATVPD